MNWVEMLEVNWVMTIKTGEGFIRKVRTVAYDEEHLVGKGKVVIYKADGDKVIMKANKIKSITQV